MEPREHLAALFQAVRARSRPLVIEVRGTPFAEKTTLINGFDSIFRHNGFRVRRPQEGAEVFRNTSRKTPLYNILTGAYGVTNVVQAVGTKDADIVLLDRALFDAFAWALFWAARGKLSPAECDAFQSFVTMRELASCVDLGLFVLCDAEEAMRRAAKDAPSAYNDRKEGGYTNPETITLLLGIFGEACRTLHEEGHPVVAIDTTTLPKEAMFDAALRELCSRFAPVS